MPYKITKPKKEKTEKQIQSTNKVIQSNTKKSMGVTPKRIETQDSINVAQNKELQQIKEEYEAQTGEVTIIKDLTNIPSFRKYTRNLNQNERKYLNTLLWPPSKDMKYEEIAQMAGISAAMGYKYRIDPDFVRAYREIALVYHQGKAPRVYNHMYNNAINSPHNKDSLDYLKATGSIEDRIGDGARQVNEAAAGMLKVAFESFVEEKANQKAREIVDKERENVDAEYEVVNEGNNAENAANLTENENGTLIKESSE